MPFSRSPTLELSLSEKSALYSYHCLCSTHLLTTPYDISNLPQRRNPSIDLARILPLPAIPTDETLGGDPQYDNENTILPSLLSANLKAARKPLVVQREDGWEKRRLWRCGRCGVVFGYEVLGEEDQGENKRADGEGKAGKVLFLLDGGLIETGKWEG